MQFETAWICVHLDESLLTSGYLVRNSSMVNPLDEVGECPAVVTSATVLPLCSNIYHNSQKQMV